MSHPGPRVSIVIIPRGPVDRLEDSLYSMSVRHQRHVAVEDYEIIVIREGREATLTGLTATPHGGNVRHLWAASPVSLRFVMEQALAPMVGFVGPGSHLVSPRFVEHLLLAQKASAHPEIVVPEYRLCGPEGEAPAVALTTVDWRKNGYALFGVSRFLEDSGAGFLGPGRGTGTVFLSKAAWFGTPTTGAVVLAGEGVFRTDERNESVPFAPFAPPPAIHHETPLVIGVIAQEGQSFLKESAHRALARHLAPRRPPEATDPLARARRRYVDLLGRSLLGTTQLDDELRIRYLLECIRGEAHFDRAVVHDIRAYEPDETMRFAISKHLGSVLDGDLENLGFDHTMIGRRRLDNIEACFHSIVEDRIPGDLMECGVWRGGAVVFMRGLLQAYEVPDRLVWVADSFQGLPSSSLPDDLAHGDLSRESFPMLAVDLETVKRTFEVHGLLDDRVKFLEGWFKDTLPGAPIERLALLRLDGDLYESTRDTLIALYDKLSPGGYLIVDDLFLPTCRRAVDDFRSARGIEEPIVPIDWTGGYWRKAR